LARIHKGEGMGWSRLDPPEQIHGADIGNADRFAVAAAMNDVRFSATDRKQPLHGCLGLAGFDDFLFDA
jgi:hypothetical protein